MQKFPGRPHFNMFFLVNVVDCFYLLTNGLKSVTILFVCLFVLTS